MSRTLVLLALLPLPLAAQDRATLSCLTDDGEAFEVTLWNPSEDTPPVHCVNTEALAEVAACAPDGGWGLTDPTAPGELLAMATDSRSVDHEGGKFFARVGPSQFVASASVGRALPLALEVSGDTFWRMQVTLESGEGVVKTAEGEIPVRCERL